MHPTHFRTSFDIGLGVRERSVWVLMVVFYFVLDPIGTYTVLQLGGLEAEPVARWFLAQFGMVGLAIQKFLFFPVVALLAGILTVAARILGQPPEIYRAVVPVIFALRGMQLATFHVENILTLL